MKFIKFALICALFFSTQTFAAQSKDGIEGFKAYQKKDYKTALKKWIKDCFIKYPEIERVGLTTWSGNQGMMRLAEKLGLILEGRLRKVRYYNGTYYDSVKYGILREEFFNSQIENEHSNKL